MVDETFWFNITGKRLSESWSLMAAFVLNSSRRPADLFNPPSDLQTPASSHARRAFPMIQPNRNALNPTEY